MRYCSLLLILFLASSKIFSQDSQTVLYNGKDLNGWDTYIGPPLDDSGKKISEIPIGLNNDPGHVFTIVDQDGEKVIRISGESWGGISTINEFADFHLRLQFKWGTLTWGQKKKKKKIVAFSILLPVNMGLIMAHGCAHRNFKSKRETAAITGESLEACRIYRR